MLRGICEWEIIETRILESADYLLSRTNPSFLPSTSLCLGYSRNQDHPQIPKIPVQTVFLSPQSHSIVYNSHLRINFSSPGASIEQNNHSFAEKQATQSTITQHAARTTNPMKQLRTIVIGVGAGIFPWHQTALNNTPFTVVGVTDVNPTVGKQRAEELGCPFYADHQTLLAETKPDTATIVTPHPFHAPLAIDCLNAGVHVLVEKSLSVSVADGDAMIRAAKRNRRLLTVSFQNRFRAEAIAAKAWIASGKLGEIQHVQMTALWPRTAIYFNQSVWRGTWKGEGGGILMNQSPHNLDMLCHLAGMPSQVFGIARTNFHKIETEDTATALFEWSNGAQGMLHVSTAETGIKERLEIVGTNGSLALTPGNLEVKTFARDIRQFLVESDNPYAGPEILPQEVELPESTADHTHVYTNFYNAITQGQPLMSDGNEAMMSLELANAITLSSHLGKPVKTPISRSRYSKLLEQLQSSR